MSKNIIHVTDPHFGNEVPTYNREKVSNALIEIINSAPGDKVLVISGDITFRGQAHGYTEATEFFLKIIEGCGIPRSNVIACPGNHDILPGTRFEEFDKFIYALRRDDVFCASDKNESIFEIDDTIFITSNSAFHLNHTYGYISESTIDKLNVEKEKIMQSKHKVFITHHHFISQQELDTSNIRNALQLLYSLNKLNFDYILHGHQHSTLDLCVGDHPSKIVSGRSMNFPDVGFHNGINTIEIETGTIKRFISTPDKDPTKLVFEEL